ncbi:hypothetical protein JL720_10548 [Aureococcus anophagefferens]|nr:hypothetical protein JL720_10548 [Aureococcus anophagefferens]
MKLTATLALAALAPSGFTAGVPARALTRMMADGAQSADASRSSRPPVAADIQLWIGPDWTPFSMKAYSEDGKLRPIQTLIGTRNKAAMIEGAMVNKPATIPAEATTSSERVDGGALRSYPIDASVKQLEVVLKTDGKQLNARIELLNAPNNPKQTFECFTNNGELNSLCVCFNIPDEYTTVRVINLAPVEFPCNVHLNEREAAPPATANGPQQRATLRQWRRA